MTLSIRVYLLYYLCLSAQQSEVKNDPGTKMQVSLRSYITSPRLLLIYLPPHGRSHNPMEVKSDLTGPDLTVSKYLYRTKTKWLAGRGTNERLGGV
jgi:hypothetical protein